MRKFNSIKKSRKKSKDIDEKIEYLDKECQKTGLNEIMGTADMYSVQGSEPNPSHNAFKSLSHDGQPLGFSGADFNIFTEPIGGLKYSPPHPVTGERQRASSWFGIASGFGPVSANSDRQILWIFDQSLAGGFGRYFSLELTGGSNPFWGTWISTAFGTEMLVPYNSSNSPLSDNIKNDLNNLNINNFRNPDDFGSPTNPVLFKNDLGDPTFLPINIPDLSGEAFDYLKNKANNNIASGVNYDLYNYLDKRFGIEASNWYENNPTLPHESNPYIPPLEAPYVPLANKKNDVKIAAEYKKIKRKYTGANDQFWDDFSNSIPGGTKNFPGKDPDDPFKFSQGHQTSSYNLEGDLLSESILKHFKRSKINEDVFVNTKFNTIKKSRKKSKRIDEKIEYLNKECKKNNLQEIMSTSNMYVDGGTVPNQDFINFEGQSQGGYKLGLSAADGNSVGGASIDTIPSGFSLAGLEGVAFSPPHPVTGQRIYAIHRTTGLGNSTPLRPGVTISRGFSDNPPQYTMGGALWFFDPNYNNGEGKWCNLEWSNFEGSKNNMWGFWDTVKTGQFAGIYKFETDLSLHPCGDIGNKIAGINFGNNGNLGTPQTIVLTKNDLGDPNSLPIDIMGLGAQAFNYLKDKAQNAAQNVKDILNDLKDAGEDFAKDFEEFMDEMGDFVADIGKAAEVYGDYVSGNLEDGDIDNDYLGQDYVDDAFTDAFINDKGTVTVGDNVIGSGGELQYNPETGIVTIPFEYDFDTNEEQIMKDPDKYDATQPDKAFFMFVAWLLGGKYGIDSVPAIPLGYATWASKSLGIGGKPTTGHGITMPIEEVKAKNFPLYSHIMQNK